MTEINLSLELAQKRMKINSDLEELELIIEIMKKHGVTKIDYPGGVKIELGAPPVKTPTAAEIEELLHRTRPVMPTDDEMLLDPYHGLDMFQKKGE